MKELEEGVEVGNPVRKLWPSEVSLLRTHPCVSNVVDLATFSTVCGKRWSKEC